MHVGTQALAKTQLACTPHLGKCEALAEEGQLDPQRVEFGVVPKGV